MRAGFGRGFHDFKRPLKRLVMVAGHLGNNKGLLRQSDFISIDLHISSPNIRAAVRPSPTWLAAVVPLYPPDPCLFQTHLLCWKRNPALANARRDGTLSGRITASISRTSG